MAPGTCVPPVSPLLLGLALTGPMENKILNADVAAVTASWEEVDSGEEGAMEDGVEDDDSIGEDDFLLQDDEWETGLFETLDAVDRADAYREVYQ